MQVAAADEFVAGLLALVRAIQIPAQKPLRRSPGPSMSAACDQHVAHAGTSLGCQSSITCAEARRNSGASCRVINSGVFIGGKFLPSAKRLSDHFRTIVQLLILTGMRRGKPRSAPRFLHRCCAPGPRGRGAKGVPVRHPIPGFQFFVVTLTQVAQ